MWIISALTAFFATVFVTLLALRPDPVPTREPSAEDSRAAQSAPSDEVAADGLPRVDAAPIAAEQIESRSADASTAESAVLREPAPETQLSPDLRDELERLGVKCAEGADCYPE